MLYRGKEAVARIEADPRRAVTLAYHDGVNFALCIKCDIYVCTGFADGLCTPSSVFASLQCAARDDQEVHEHKSQHRALRNHEEHGRRQASLGHLPVGDRKMIEARRRTATFCSEDSAK